MISVLVGNVYPLGCVIYPGHPVEGYGVGVNGDAWATGSGFHPQIRHPGPRRTRHPHRGLARQNLRRGPHALVNPMGGLARGRPRGRPRGHGLPGPRAYPQWDPDFGVERVFLVILWLL